MLTIAGLTFKEALRKKILVAAVILTLIFLALYGLGLHFAAQDMERLSRESGAGAGGDAMTAAQASAMASTAGKVILILGIYFSSSIVSILAIFSSVGSVSSEIENGMLHAMMAKPIRRRSIILGKYTGYALMLSIYAAVLFASVLLLNHYFTGLEIPPTLPQATGLFILQPLVLLAVTIAGSTRLSTLANGITAFMLYTIGVIGGMVEQIGAMTESTTLKFTGIISSLLIPVDSIYRMVTQAIFGVTDSPFEAMMFGPFGAISRPSDAMIIYIFVYLLAFLLLAVRVFSKRDIG